MFAIYKRELAAYFNTPIGYIFREFRVKRQRSSKTLRNILCWYNVDFLVFN